MLSDVFGESKLKHYCIFGYKNSDFLMLKNRDVEVVYIKMTKINQPFKLLNCTGVKVKLKLANSQHALAVS